MPGVELNSDEIHLREQVKESLDKLRDDIHGNKIDQKTREEIYKNMALAAHELHMSLKNRGFEPIHHGYMIKNRGMNSDDPDFYNHIHPSEDLLKFIDDMDANKDPEDQTLDDEFDFFVYTRRWGHEDGYKFTRNLDGWYIEAVSRSAQCDETGNPVLYEALIHDSINYPADLGGYLAWLWKRANEDGLSHDEVQDALTQIAKWVSMTERNSPKGIFRGYK